MLGTRLMTDSYEAHRRALFGVCYRMTGSAADAEDLVQETFRRALERPPPDADAPLRPWLIRVATNLCIDTLRKRQREGYFGPWLPSPVETNELAEPLELGPEARYGLLESASNAFLIALEALDARQRAVLVLRDVLGASGAETAAMLDESEGNVRVILHRARKALAGYDRERAPLDAAQRQKTGARLRQLLLAVAAGQTALAVELLSEDVTSHHDAAGEVIAAVVPVVGRARVLELYEKIQGSSPWPEFMHERDLNGLPAMVVQLPSRPGRHAERCVMSVELGPDDRIRAIRCVFASRKLTATRFPTR